MDIDIDNIDIAQIVKEIPSIMAVEEAQFLHDIVYRVPSHGAIVEIGSYLGGSTIILAHAARAGHKGMVYAIDPHRGALLWNLPFGRRLSLEPFLDNIRQAGLSDFVTPLVGSSSKIHRTWNKPISLLWIDGSHWYRAVKQDLLNWEPLVVEGGFIVMHDAVFLKIRRDSVTHTSNIPARFFGVEQAAHEMLKTGRFEVIATVTCLLCVVKKQSGTASEFRRERFLRPFKSIIFFPLEVSLCYYRDVLKVVHQVLGWFGQVARSLGLLRR